MASEIPATAPRSVPLTARVLLRPLTEGLVGLALTAALVLAITHAVLDRVSLEGLTLNVILRTSSPFPDMGTARAVAVALGRSGVILVAALGGAALVGIGAGVAYAVVRSRPLRGATWALGTLGVTLPSFCWALLLQLALITVASRTGEPPLPFQGYGLDRHIILPAIALGLRPVAIIFRTTAAALEDARHQDFIRLARAKGLSERQVLLRHLLPTALPTALSGLGLAARGALSSLAIIEYVFDWHGAGYGFIWALARGDRGLVTAIAVAFAVLFALVGSGTAVVGRLLDPRIER